MKLVLNKIFGGLARIKITLTTNLKASGGLYDH
ncbi:hypothetical protein DR85_1445 [Francisella tularensis]|nr:hypothetical protein DR85_1445 [Francisella tularensis]